jgi:hypothetical protein
MTNMVYLKWCFLSFLMGGMVMAQKGPIKVVAELPGNVLQWIHVAEPAFAQEKLNIENYKIMVIDYGSTVTVVLTSNETSHARGSAGKYPGYEVSISKKTRKILKAYYAR